MPEDIDPGQSPDSDIAVETCLRTHYLVKATMGRVNMADGNSQDRADRLKAALKENLKRRKAQAKGRRTAKAVGTETGSLSVSGERDKPSD